LKSEKSKNSKKSKESGNQEISLFPLGFHGGHIKTYNIEKRLSGTVFITPLKYN